MMLESPDRAGVASRPKSAALRLPVSSPMGCKGRALNYYERHIGDYLKDTAHLSIIEHGVYTRLLDIYYTREGPIPQAEVARLVGARSKEERAALDVVLAEFFACDAGAYRQRRCDAEIERFQDKQRKAKASAEKRWQHTERSADAMRTHTEGNAPRARPQTPDTRHQTKEDPQPPAGADPESAQEPKPKRPAIGLKAWLSDLKARGEKPVPPDDPIFDYATRVKLPEEFLSLAWLAFKHRYTTQHPDKRYRDWRKVFRNAVEGNWAKLWWLDPAAGTYGLTTVGQQAKRDHDARAAA